jgi:hypothetical protein
MRTRPPSPGARLILGAAALLGLLGFAVAPRAGGAERPRPAGKNPSPIATMPCLAKTQRELAAALGEKARVLHPTWFQHRYSCTYRYAKGSYTVSIQELSSWGQTFAYYDSFKHRFGDAGPLSNLGQGAYQTENGDVVVRKDWKVLLVDVSHLPARFGKPPTAAPYVAVTVADVILGCWAGD